MSLRLAYSDLAESLTSTEEREERDVDEAEGRGESEGETAAEDS